MKQEIHVDMAEALEILARAVTEDYPAEDKNDRWVVRYVVEGESGRPQFRFVAELFAFGEKTPKGTR